MKLWNTGAFLENGKLVEKSNISEAEARKNTMAWNIMQ